MLERTRSEFACQLRCLNTLRRTVWDGDQVLYEISAPGSSTATAAQMEADTGLAVPFFQNAQQTAVAGFFPYGRVLYEHGGGIDAPLGVVRMEYSDELHDPQVILPHADWRGTYDRGTTIGSCFLYGSNGQFVAPPPDSTPDNGDGTRIVGGQYDGSTQHCISVDWPAAYTWSARQYRRGYDGPISWMGSLIYESRDASGLYYRRNRFYDSEKGRFTQEDPIGLAGGMNVYGFVNGDPITFIDPFGLCPPCRMSEAGLARIRRYEQFRSKVYNDEAGNPTVGYGHLLTPGESFPTSISHEEANELFAQDVAEKVNPSLDKITVDLNQNQVDALGSFIFNAGEGTFQRYVLPALNKGDFAEATAQIASIRRAGGHVFSGLGRSAYC